MLTKENVDMLSPQLQVMGLAAAVDELYHHIGMRQSAFQITLRQSMRPSPSDKADRAIIQMLFVRNEGLYFLYSYTLIVQRRIGKGTDDALAVVQTHVDFGQCKPSLDTSYRKACNQLARQQKRQKIYPPHTLVKRYPNVSRWKR